jgi:acyl-CoA synthetase (AMP-forming)/AMP-acid ligase II
MFNNFVELYENSVRSFSDRTAYRFKDETLTYAELSEKVDAVCGYVQHNYVQMP